MTAETERSEQIAALLIMTQFSETYLNSLDSHELYKLYSERIIDR